MDVDKEQEDEDVDEEEMAALDNEANIAKKKRSRYVLLSPVSLYKRRRPALLFGPGDPPHRTS